MRHGGLRPTWRSCRSWCGRSSPASIKIEKINGGKGDDDSGETEPKHITNIVPGHPLPRIAQALVPGHLGTGPSWNIERCSKVLVPRRTGTTGDRRPSYSPKTRRDGLR